jgi:hypothetical protein
MQYGIVIAVVAGAAVVVLLIWRATARETRRRERDQQAWRARMYADARAFAAAVQQKRVLPVVATNVILKPGEVAFYSAPSTLYETREVRHYQTDRAGARSLGSQQWRQIDTGTLTITNKRLIFDGLANDRTVPLSKILSVHTDLMAIAVSVEGRRKGMVLDAANPLILAFILRLCCQVDDPRDLSQTELDVTFVG